MSPRRARTEEDEKGSELISLKPLSKEPGFLLGRQVEVGTSLKAGRVRRTSWREVVEGKDMMFDLKNKWREWKLEENK